MTKITSPARKNAYELGLDELKGEAFGAQMGIRVLKEFLSALRGELPGLTGMARLQMDQAMEETDWIADKLHQHIDRISDLADLQAEPLHDTEGGDA